MRHVLLLPFLLAACSQPPAPSLPQSTLPFFGDGYPSAGDACRRLGEDTYTSEFLDDAADLVGCPETFEGLDAFVAATRAIEVGRRDGFVLYSVPRR